MKLTAEEIGTGRIPVPAAAFHHDVLRCANQPFGTGDVIAGCPGVLRWNFHQANLWIVGRSNLLFIIGTGLLARMNADRLFHVRLAGAQPDLANHHVAEGECVHPSNC